MTVNMRDFIQAELDKHALGKLIAVVGPERGGRHNDQDWWQIAIKYRPEVGGHHFDDGRIEVCIGYRKKGGYWNRRQIRVAIAQEAKAKRTDEVVKVVWTSAQRELTSGPGRNAKGAFEL